MRQMQWWVLSFLAAIVLLGSAGGFFLVRRPKVAPPVAVVPLAPRRCPNMQLEAKPLLAEEEVAVLLLWAAGKVRLSVDGTPAFSPPEAPKRFAPGEHLLRAQAEGVDPLELHFRLDAFHPAFFHLEVSGEAGLTVSWLGTAGTAQGEKVNLDFTRTSQADGLLLTGAAQAERAGDWTKAASLLRGVSPKSRGHALFLRLAANVYEADTRIAARSRFPSAGTSTIVGERRPRPERRPRSPP